jgi:hypothetical protein
MTVSDTSGFLVASTWNYDTSNNLTTGIQDELRFQDAAGGDYVALRAPASVTTHTYDLPIAAGTAGQVLSWQAGGQLQWINAAGGGTINSGTQFQLAYYAANGTTLSGLPLITALRAIQSDADGLPVASVTTAAELAFVSGVTSAIQTQLNLKAPLASPTFTGTVTIPSPFVLGATSVTASGTEMNFLIGVTSAIQTQLNTKATDSLVVHLAGTETITGAKTFTAAPTISQITGAQNYLTLLDVTDNQASYLGLTGTATSVAFRISANRANPGTSIQTGQATSDIILNSGISDSFIQFRTTLTNDVGPTERMRITGDGLVGIGTTPSYPLHLLVNNTDLTSTFRIEQSGTGDPLLSFAVTGVQLWHMGIDNSSNDRFAIGQGGLGSADSLRINATGNVEIVGTITNDNAPAGWVGEYIASAQPTAQNAAATTEFTDLVSISLTPGDWDVSGILQWNQNGATWSDARLGISSTAGNSTAGLSTGDNTIRVSFTSSSTTPVREDLQIPAFRVSLSSTTTYYLKYAATYSAGTPTAAGRISARRVR